jgi:16S rRNA C1402 (ribose-2'-O) methylase RsmI
VVIVVQAGPLKPIEPDDIEQMLFELLDQGVRASDAAKQVASATGVARSDLYQLAMTRKATRAESPASDDA